MDLSLQMRVAPMWNCYCKFSGFFFFKAPPFSPFSLPLSFTEPGALCVSLQIHHTRRRGGHTAPQQWALMTNPGVTVPGEAEVPTSLAPPVSLDLEMKMEITELHLKHWQGQGPLSWQAWKA